MSSSGSSIPPDAPISSSPLPNAIKKTADLKDSLIVDERLRKLGEETRRPGEAVNPNTCQPNANFQLITPRKRTRSYTFLEQQSNKDAAKFNALTQQQQTNVSTPPLPSADRMTPTATLSRFPFSPSMRIEPSAVSGTPNATTASYIHKRHTCEQCGKVYKHRNCLSKHRWEHHEAWEVTKKICSTKHQQVQLLEAAQVLIEMQMFGLR